ncbi:Uma2 family endonuclease [Tundrisphaera lichenicola]|uniref:Uma2 family endonuclease n=1 Tax=Tundrisphaera lichenicola TaxID=2029860 RepID=UPI003EBC8A53
MSTVGRPEPRVLPALINGQLLDQPTFHRRYQAMPPGTWAELIAGIVHMPSPLFDNHGGEYFDLSGWLFHYRRFTPGVRGVSNVSTILGEGTEVQPDLQLRLSEESGGRARVEGGYVVGPPELVIEIGGSSRSHDLGSKKNDYEKAGVLEYLFVGVEPHEVRWFVRREGRFAELFPGPDGIYRSEAFPGLWLNARALSAGDLDGLIGALERGLATPEHAAFVAELAHRAAGR